jgi:glutamate synthase (NADPH/NADH) small chain
MDQMDPRELQRLEELCIQDDAPFCEAACPLHVDVRTMLGAVAQGDFAAGAETFRKRVPLPGVLSRICDQPCRAVCKRREAGGAIKMGFLERSCAEYVGFSTVATRLGSQKDLRVAVVGAGLSGLSAAIELARKNYPVILFEAEERLGGRLLTLGDELLPPEALQEDLTLLQLYGVEIRTGARLCDELALSTLAQEYDAVYLSIGSEGPPEGCAEPEATLLLQAWGEVDETTLATPLVNVFLGGSALRAGRPYSPVRSMADGCRAAVSIDRFLKRESLTVNRDKEGPYQTRLYTSLEGIEPARPISPKDSRVGYDRTEAVAEAARCLQCECLECVNVCTYLQHFNEYPGKCIRKVTKNIISVPGKSYRTFTKFLNACSLCGLCGVVCPTDLDMAVVNGQARRIMCEKGFMPPAIHDFALRDMESSSVEPSGLTRNQPGRDSSSYLFFPGCQLAASAPQNVERTYRFLMERLSGGVGLMLRCCGAPALWSGRQEVFNTMADGFSQRWRDLGSPTVILACPTCSLTFGRELPDIPVVSLWEVLDTHGLPDGAPSGEGRTLAVHDSCTARFARDAQNSVRSLLTGLGYDLEELPYSRELTKCCGYGGLLYQVNPVLTKKVVRSRVEESNTDYVTYCSNCRDFFAGEAKPAYHVLDLVFDGHPGRTPARPGPTLSERRNNRRYLAKKLLNELWGETMAEDAEYLGKKLLIPPDVAAKMEREFILADDLQQVIYQAEKTGDKLYLPATDHFVAHHQPSIVTYWVEYAVHGGEFEVFNAYSHRMRIVKDGNRDES